jgi:hypothetical protein
MRKKGEAVRRLVCVVLGLSAAFTVATPVYAAPSPDVNDIIEALQESPVYVAEGADGTNSDTAAMLEAQLNDADNIVIVMLPSDEVATAEEADVLADQIARELDDGSIVAVAAGDSYGADGDILPAGTADQLMHNADTVSQSTIDTIGTFIRNVHDWVRMNPTEVAPLPEVAAAGPDLTWLLFVVGGIAALGTGGVLAISFARRRTHKKVRYSAPGELNADIRGLTNLIPRIPDRSGLMARAIHDVCRHTEAFFTRLSSKRRDDAAIEAFRNHLARARRVIDVYIDVQRNSEYFDEPDKVREEALVAIQNLAESIRTSVKRNNREMMLEFTVNTKVLDAERHR